MVQQNRQFAGHGSPTPGTLRNLSTSGYRFPQCFDLFVHLPDLFRQVRHLP